MVETILIVISVFYILFMIEEKCLKFIINSLITIIKKKTHFLGKTYNWSMFITF